MVSAVATPQRHVPLAASAASAIPPQLPPFDDNGYALDDRWIGRGCTFVRNVPRTRLSECLTQISGKLESGFTAECTQMGLLALLWLYTRIKPSVKITDLLPSGDFV